MTPKINEAFVIAGFSEKGQILSCLNPNTLVGTDSLFFAEVLAIIARGYVDMMIENGRLIDSGEKPREIDREYMEASLVEDFNQRMREGKNGEVLV